MGNKGKYEVLGQTLKKNVSSHRTVPVWNHSALIFFSIFANKKMYSR